MQKPTTPELKNFLFIPYDELEKLNLEAKKKAADPNVSPDEMRQHYSQYLQKEERIKAVTICFTDLEGRFHMLDYDKKFLLKSYNNLTFDGSSVRGFSQVEESDLRIEPDWETFRWLPSDVFGPGKVLMFGLIKDRDGRSYSSDMRSLLKNHIGRLYATEAMLTNFSVECEGFLFNGVNAEQHYSSAQGFEMVSGGGYFNSLPQDPLRLFIDAFADAQRAMGFENEKDHPEVAPSQFELNYTYTNALQAADELQMYKLLARQIAANMGKTACFLPKPIAGINGNGMHCNVSLSREGQNLFYGGKAGEISNLAKDFIERILFSANDLSLILNPSVNAYRRLDPHFEAPNQIKFSANDRTSMIRIPLGNEKTSRIEVRSVAPDANPYMVFLSILRTGLEGPMETSTDPSKRARTKFLPDNIHDAIRHFKSSELIQVVLGGDTRDKYINCKQASAFRCPKDLGKKVKDAEIWYHHEVTNQYLWSQF